MSLLLLGAARPAMAIPGPDGAPYKVEIAGRSWQVEPSPDKDLLMIARPDHTEIASFGWISGWRPDLALVDIKALSAALSQPAAGQGWAFGDPARSVHPTLGTVVQTRATQPDKVLEFYVFEDREGLGVVSVVCARQGNRPCPGTSAVLQFVQPSGSPAPVASGGHVVTEHGFELDLPSGWRMLSGREVPQRPSGVDAEIVGFADVSDFERLRAVLCIEQHRSEPEEVVDPSRDPRWAEGYRVRTRALLAGTSYHTVRMGTVQERYRVVGGGLGDQLVLPADDVAGLPGVIRLEDRDAWLWQIPGARPRVMSSTHPVSEGKPWDVGVFYTSFGDTTLDCNAVEPSGAQRLLPLFAQIMGTVRVTNGADHPVRMGWSAWTVRNWPAWMPYSDPKWVMVGVATSLLAVFLAALRVQQTRSAPGA